MNSYAMSKIPDSYKLGFFSTYLGCSFDSIKPEIWGVNDNNKSYELLADDVTSVLKADVIASYLKLQRDSGYIIRCYSRKPLNIADISFNGNDQAYLKYTFWNFNLNRDEREPLNAGGIKVIERYDAGLDRQLRHLFVNDRRLYLNESKMRKIYEAEIYNEFGKIVMNCEHLYFLKGNDLAGYVAGLYVDDDIYGFPYYLIACIWLSEMGTVEDKVSIKCSILEWLCKRHGPYAAAIYSSNTPSIKFFSKLGFSPYFMRIIPW